jgi:hypothetical protein
MGVAVDAGIGMAEPHFAQNFTWSFAAGVPQLVQNLAIGYSLLSTPVS